MLKRVNLNRMTSLTVGSTATNYAYRSDGLRVSKSSSSGSTVYRYDGQMGIEDVELNSSSAITGITRNALGARGIDAISRTTSSGTTVAYPLYDAHGNNVGMLSKSGSSWSLGDERTYDAWGQVRSGATTGDQKGRYCANLGHKQDDESGLIYMGARHYEPTSGRFVSQDPARDGGNWFAYSVNDPVNFKDGTGKAPIKDIADVIQKLMDGLKALGYHIPAVLVATIAKSIYDCTKWLNIGRWGYALMIDGVGAMDTLLPGLGMGCAVGRAAAMILSAVLIAVDIYQTLLSVQVTCVLGDIDLNASGDGSYTGCGTDLGMEPEDVEVTPCTKSLRLMLLSTSQETII